MEFSSEEEVRSFYILPLLKKVGIEPKSVKLETQIKAQFGTNKVFRGRSDVLVKNHNGKNLIIFEVKSDGKEITQEVINQGLSYSRIVEGNLVPITVISNRQENLIIDSISGEIIEELDGIKFEKLINYNFSNSEEINSLRREALESLLSSRNELVRSFFDSQVSNSILPIRGKFTEHKKYQPEAYIKIVETISKPTAEVIVIKGKPQSGKTNYLCKCLEELQKENLCLFYSAYKLSNGLDAEVRKTFEDFFDFHIDNYKRVLSTLSKSSNIIVFIDGINEVNNNIKDKILYECEYYNRIGLKIIISSSNYATDKLFFDSNQNPTFIDHLKQNKKDKYFEIEIPELNTEMALLFYRKYSELYDVEIPESHQLSTDPFAIRLAMETYRSNKLPTNLDISHLLELSLKARAKVIDRVLGINSINLLSELACSMLKSSSPINESWISNKLFNNSYQRTPEIFISQGLLEQDNSDYLYFYYDSFRDHLISQKYIDRDNLVQSVSSLFQLDNKEIAESVLFKYLLNNSISLKELSNMEDEAYEQTINSILSYVYDSTPCYYKLAYLLEQSKLICKADDVITEKLIETIFRALSNLDEDKISDGNFIELAELYGYTLLRLGLERVQHISLDYGADYRGVDLTRLGDFTGKESVYLKVAKIAFEFEEWFLDKDKTLFLYEMVMLNIGVDKKSSVNEIFDTLIDKCLYGGSEWGCPAYIDSMLEYPDDIDDDKSDYAFITYIDYFTSLHEISNGGVDCSHYIEEFSNARRRYYKT